MKAVSAAASERSTTTGSFIRALALSKFTEFASNEGLRPTAMLRLVALPVDVNNSPSRYLPTNATAGCWICAHNMPSSRCSVCGSGCTKG